MSAQPVSTRTPSSLTPDVLRTLPARRHGVHPLLKAVHTTYRAQHRKPQLEPIFVGWIERFLRLFPEEPAGRLALCHVHTFFRRVEREEQLTPNDREQARAALRFLRTDILHFAAEG